ncbi:alpha/beta hydrolase [Porticoccaceae bacterium]|nr:alpha/beta hydrolase [Porticoccaceae bacterium]
MNNLGFPPLPSHSPDTSAALLWVRELLQMHLTATYAVQDPNGIEELKSVKIGGIDQWLHIRGRDRNNPILLCLHGGPGESMLGYMDAIQRPWEDYFTVVHWDQRQTGKSYYPADDENSPLSLGQFVEDTAQLIQYLRDYFKQEKLFVLGHSWGSVLGMYMVNKHPEWLHAYIGVGQVVNQMASETVIYQRLLQHAQAQNKIALVEKMQTLLPMLDAESPAREKSFAENCAFVRKELSEIARETVSRHTPYNDVLQIVGLDKFISPHLTIEDLDHMFLGQSPALVRPSSYAHLTKDFLEIDLPNQLGLSFDVPIFFFSGRHDYQTPVALSDQWFSEIDAPYKELIHFEESSHMIMNEEPGRVFNALINKVLPFAQAKTKLMAASSHG